MRPALRGRFGSRATASSSAPGRFAHTLAAGKGVEKLAEPARTMLRKQLSPLRTGSQGIVVAGTRVGTVQILDNIVEGVAQGIHVGTSDAGRRGRETADCVM